MLECGVCREPGLVEGCLGGVGVVSLGEMEELSCNTFDEGAEESVWFIVLRVGVVADGN